MEKLKQVEKEINSECPDVKVRVIQIDLSGNCSMDHYRRILDETEDLDISVVIPNAGFAKIGRYDKIPEEVIQQMLDINIYHVGAVTKLFYPRLLARTLKNPGLHSGILTVSSVASDSPLGYVSIYHATKAWVTYLAISYKEHHFASTYMTEGLTLEHQRAAMPWSNMVDTLLLKPGLTVSNMPPKHILKFATPTNLVVQGTINNLGQYSTTYGYWQHELTGALFGAIYESAAAVLPMIAKGMAKEADYK